MRKLIVLPGYCDNLGGVLISSSMLSVGFKSEQISERLCLLARSGSLMEQYLRQTGQDYCLQTIPARNRLEFVKRSLLWVQQQPPDYPLLLDNCVSRELIPALIRAAPALRWSGRSVHHIFRDLALSYNPLGRWARKLAFACLNPVAICNSQFTAQHIRQHLVPIQAILYPPIDLQRFKPRHQSDSPPANLKPILELGAQIILTPSRISEPDKVNDKNLRALLPVLAHLKALGHRYHAVVIGQDASPGKTRTADLLNLAQNLEVADCFTVLPPTFEIENYYRYANVVLTLAPREPFGRTVGEAIACGVPVVGSNTGGVGEILHHFAPQWTCEAHNPLAVAETIIRLSADPNTPNLLAQGQNWLKNNCNVTSYTRKIVEITGLDWEKQGDMGDEGDKEEKELLMLNRGC